MTPMKVFLVGIAVGCLAMPSIVQSVVAQEGDPRCNDVFDKVACNCALQNGGRIIPPPVGVKREGMKLRAQEGPTQTLDGGQVAFPKYFKKRWPQSTQKPRFGRLPGVHACEWPQVTAHA